MEYFLLKKIIVVKQEVTPKNKTKKKKELHKKIRKSETILVDGMVITLFLGAI